MTPTAGKRALRQAGRAMRDSLDPEARRRMSAEVVRHLCDFLARNPQLQHIGIYKAMRSEVNLDALVPWCAARGRVIYAPRISAQEAGLEFVPIGAETVWTPAGDGFLEPVGEGVAASDLRLVFVPGLLFDDGGYRLGYGGGHYDRALHNTMTCAVGVCFSAQRTPQLPIEPHDVRLHARVDEWGMHIYPGHLPQTIASQRLFP